MQNVEECMCEIAEVFSKPTVETSVKSSKTYIYYPVSRLSNEGPFEFHLPALGAASTRPSKTKLCGTVRIVKKDGTEITEDDNVSIVNMFPHALFKQVDYQIGEVIVSDASAMYGYRAYLETLLSYNCDAKYGHLRAGMWCKDSAGNLDSMSTDNEGYTTRQGWIANSKPFDFVIPLQLDTNHQCRILPSTITEKIKLIRNNDSFALLGDSDNYKIEIMELSLHVEKITPQDSVWVNFQKQLSRTPARYPIPRAVMKSYTLPKGNMNGTLNNIFTTQIPRQILIGIVSTEAYHGSITKNPWNFRHYNLNNLQFYVNGEPVPAHPFKPDFKQGLYMKSYLSLFDGTGLDTENEGLDISHKDYGNGYTLFVVDLTPDRCGGDHLHPRELGNVRCEMTFSEELKETVNIIVYGVFENEIKIDVNGKVTTDFQI